MMSKCCINIPLLFVFKLQKKLLFIGFPCIFAFRRLGAQSTSDNIFFLENVSSLITQVWSCFLSLILYFSLSMNGNFQEKRENNGNIQNTQFWHSLSWLHMGNFFFLVSWIPLYLKLF